MLKIPLATWIANAAVGLSGVDASVVDWSGCERLSRQSPAFTLIVYH